MLDWKRNMTLVLLLLAIPVAAVAGEVKTDVSYPQSAITVAAAQGDIALWVEDARVDQSFGRAVDGESLMPASDTATSLYAYMVSSLKAAGYHVIPYSNELACGLLVHIRTITYTGSRAAVKSKVTVSAVLDAKMNGSNTTRTYRTAVEDQFAFSPSPADNASMIGSALASAAAAVLADITLPDQPEPSVQQGDLAPAR